MHASMDYRFRAPTPDDLEAVGEVLVAEGHDAGRVVLDADFVREEWSRAGFDLATDAWVVTDGEGAIVGYGQAVHETPGVVDSWGVVHPEHRGRGIGGSLLDRIEARGSELLEGQDSPRFRHAIYATDRAAASMLEARGLRPVRHFWHMEIDLEGQVEPGPAPGGIEIRAVDGSIDLPAVHAVLDDSFADHWGHESQSFEKWAQERTSSPAFDPSLWLLATEDGHPAGALAASILGENGWVDDLGVVAPYRGRGIGAALLRRSFAAFAGRGIRRALLNVDAESPTGATALYERAGMRIATRWDLWERARLTG